mmetsp:Transcript_50890/g.168504  ORF Transcript_50890/g.168504 Transcript_50890/m.168504 type:complete len:200 (-) Transcript_50890:159-758(-)
MPPVRDLFSFFRQRWIWMGREVAEREAATKLPSASPMEVQHPPDAACWCCSAKCSTVGRKVLRETALRSGETRSPEAASASSNPMPNPSVPSCCLTKRGCEASEGGRPSGAASRADASAAAAPLPPGVRGTTLTPLRPDPPAARSSAERANSTSTPLRPPNAAIAAESAPPPPALATSSRRGTKMAQTPTSSSPARACL